MPFTNGIHTIIFLNNFEYSCCWQPIAVIAECVLISYRFESRIHRKAGFVFFITDVDLAPARYTHTPSPAAIRNRKHSVISAAARKVAESIIGKPARAIFHFRTRAGAQFADTEGLVALSEITGSAPLFMPP